MAYLAIDLAIYERLTGAPLDGQGRPLLDSRGVPRNRSCIAPPLHPKVRLPSYGIRIPQIKENAANSEQVVRPSDILLRSWRQVPVFSDNMTGELFQNAWPAVSFYWFGESFNGSTYVYADPFIEPDPGAPTVEINNRELSGPTRARYRGHPDAYDVTYVIRAWALDPTELRLICKRIKELFPARGALEVEQANGDKTVFDMMLESVENLDESGQNVEASIEAEQRNYSRGFIYRIEAYEDNTMDEASMWVETTVRSRLLELARVQGTLVENVGLVDLPEAKAVK
jgi:hypothetical protein